MRIAAAAALLLLAVPAMAQQTTLQGPPPQRLVIACGSPVANTPSPQTECCPTFRTIYAGLAEPEKSLVRNAYMQWCIVPPEMELILACHDVTSCCGSAATIHQYLNTEHYLKVREFNDKYCTFYDPSRGTSKRVTMPPRG